MVLNLQPYGLYLLARVLNTSSNVSGDNTKITEEIGTRAYAWLSVNTEHLAESLAQSKCEMNTVDLNSVSPSQPDQMGCPLF